MDHRALPPEPGTAASPSSRGEISVVEVLNTLLRRRRMLVAIPVAVAVVVAAGSLLRPRTYTAESRFITQSGDSRSSALSGLAAQVGIDVGRANATESLSFYTELLLSRELLDSVALTRYRLPARTAGGKPASGNLLQLYGIEGERPDARLRAAVRRLREDVSVQVDQGAGIITLTTIAPWPELAGAINRRMLELLNDFNLQRRQSQARAERQFAETRLTEAGRELRAAEAELQRFLEQNRSYIESPSLQVEADRLRRAVNLRQQVYDGLAQARERARLDEVRNTPVITIIDSPEGSVRRTPRRLLIKTVLAAIMAAFAAMALVLGGEYMRRLRRLDPEPFAEFDELKHQALADLVPGRIRASIATLGNGGADQDTTRRPGARASSRELSD